MGQAISVRKQPADDRFCPYVLEPFKDCYCMKMGSQDIEKMLFFCRNNFESCEIYSRRFLEHKVKKQKIRTIAGYYDKGG